jgi:hypothetical protein
MPDMFIQRKNRVSKGLKNCTNISTFKLWESFFFVSVYVHIFIIWYLLVSDWSFNGACHCPRPQNLVNEWL